MTAEKESLVTFRITIDTPEGIPSIWRELAICGEASLAELSGALETAFGWAGIHKHEFIGHDGSWKATDPQYGPPEFDDSYKNEEEVYVKDVATRNSEAFTYNYDLTDPWSHIVEVLEIQTGNFEHHKAMMVGGGRNGVPEDCGGASGFQEFLEAVTDSSDPEHKAMTAWYKTECPNRAEVYDPEYLNIDEINKKLASRTPAKCCQLPFQFRHAAE